MEETLKELNEMHSKLVWLWAQLDNDEFGIDNFLDYEDVVSYAQDAYISLGIFHDALKRYLDENNS